MLVETAHAEAGRFARRARYIETESSEDPTLAQALEKTHRERWQGGRAAKSTLSQARIAVEYLAALAVQAEEADQNGSAIPLCDDDDDDMGLGDEEHWAGHDGRDQGAASRLLSQVRVSLVTPAHITIAVKAWRSAGKAAGTINKRLNCLSAIGFDVTGKRARRVRRLKWWLAPDVEAALVGELMRGGDDLMADYITWTTRTGLRVQETLALRRSSFSTDASGAVVVTVPGLKTSMAQATLPLGEEAVEVFQSRFPDDCAPDVPMFRISYQTLLVKWTVCRAMISAEGDPLSTLKALRRSAARYLHVTKGMPLDLVRNYLRHENIATTMEYLRLTGGYGTGEYRKWL